MNWLMLIAGLVILTGGAEVLIRGSVALARRFNLSELLIGLTLVGFGTSTPEMVSSIQAALVGSPGVAVGNVVGSNIYNILGILGATALVKPVAVPPEILRFDNWVMLGATAAMILFSLTHRRISRREGWVLLTGYVVYVGWLVAHAAG